MTSENSLTKVTVGFCPLTKGWYLIKPSNNVKNNVPLVTWGANRKSLPFKTEQRPTSIHKPLLFNGFVKHHNGKLLFGPLMGILTVQNGHAPFAGVRQNFIDIIRTGQKKGGIVYVFTPQGINWKEGTVRGYLYHAPLKQWISYQFPLPNVVYNRIPDRLSEQRHEVQTCLRLLQKQPNVHLFNPSFFNKDEICLLLMKNKRTAAHVPDTQMLRTSDTFVHMLQRHESLYLKPIHGKAGQGIFRADYDPDRQQYTLTFHQNRKTRRLISRSVQAIWRSFLKLKTGGTYLAQQAISLARLNHAPFDIRTLVQKNRNGSWTVAGMGLRVAGPNRITTHVPQGGHIEQIDHTLTQIFPDEAKQIIAQARRLALLAATVLENHYRHLGELSLDIGLDQFGRLWIFEANAKPMKFDEPHIRKKSLLNLIEYAQYLTFHTTDQGADQHDLIPAN